MLHLASPLVPLGVRKSHQLALGDRVLRCIPHTTLEFLSEGWVFVFLGASKDTPNWHWSPIFFPKMSRSLLTLLFVLVGVFTVHGFVPVSPTRTCGIPLYSATSEANPNEIVARRIIVTGNVQGGYYRSCVLNEVRSLTEESYCIWRWFRCFKVVAHLFNIDPPPSKKGWPFSEINRNYDSTRWYRSSWNLCWG